MSEGGLRAKYQTWVKQPGIKAMLLDRSDWRAES